ncbi:glycosyltransferase [Alteromonas sp. D210916BOD_24]|uniref:glycosyltransferase n=1 Tax=Alteromonas sp. D210916BOD_24 TaxID=3157618 RepID=UPI00399D273A
MKNQFSILDNNYAKKEVETVVALAVYQADNAVWLKQSVESILTQSYKSFVFVIVIDGPIPQNLLAILTDAVRSDSRVILAQHSENKGLAGAMNNAIDYTSQYNPSFFVRMDADDVSEQNRLHKQINFLKRHKTVSVLGSALTEINEYGKKVGARVMPTTHKRIVSMLPRRCSMNHPTVAIRFDVFRDGHRYDESLRNTQDYFLWILLASKGYIFRNLSDRLLKFRRVNDFYKRRGYGKSLNEFKARLYAINKLKQYSPHNFVYACGVLMLRLMPSNVVKIAYKLDRHLLERFHKH